MVLETIQLLVWLMNIVMNLAIICIWGNVAASFHTVSHLYLIVIKPRTAATIKYMGIELTCDRYSFITLNLPIL